MGPLLCITFSCGIGLRYVALWAELLNEVSQKKNSYHTIRVSPDQLRRSV